MGHASSWICMHSRTFWNILHAFWNILEHSECILEHSGTFCMHSGTFWNILQASWNFLIHSACLLEHSGTFWNILDVVEGCRMVGFQVDHTWTDIQTEPNYYIDFIFFFLFIKLTSFGFILVYF